MHNVVLYKPSLRWSTTNWSKFETVSHGWLRTTDRSYRHSDRIHKTLPIDDMLADRFYVSGRKLAQYNNILIDR